MDENIPGKFVISTILLPDRTNTKIYQLQLGLMKR